MSRVQINMDNIIIQDFIEINQPIGKFILCTMSPQEVLRLSKPYPREYNESEDAFVGVQRQLDKQKIKELKEYITTSDACFPNAIIANLDTDFLLSYSEKEVIISLPSSQDPLEKPLFIIDGQHRLESFRDYPEFKFDIILAIFLGLEPEEQAYLFSTINSKQKRLNQSLVQDLNDLFYLETPEKIVHAITKIFNDSQESPWKDKIKILGKDVIKNGERTRGIMSQYSFAKEITNLIYPSGKSYFTIRNFLRDHNNNRLELKNHPKITENFDKYPLWEHYVNKNDKYIYHVLCAYFSAIKNNFPGWGDSNYITTKTTGYIAFMKLFVDIIRLNQDSKSPLTQELFESYFKKDISNSTEELKSNNYGPGKAGQKKLYETLKNAYFKNIC